MVRCRSALATILVALLSRQADGLGCIAWRQTANCDPNGAREPTNDRVCLSRIPPGASGYCECSDGSRRAVVSCKHPSFTCIGVCTGEIDETALGVSEDGPHRNSAEDAAPGDDDRGIGGDSTDDGKAHAEEVSEMVKVDLSCVGWSQTGSCDPAGPREPANDRACDTVVDAASSGYCSCADDVRAASSRCGHPPFTCAAVCRARLATGRSFEWRDPGLLPCRLLPGDPPVSHSSQQCGARLSVSNESGRRLALFWITLEGRENKVQPIPPAVSLHVATCVGHAWRVRDGAGRVLSELRVESPARTSWRVRECAARRRELSATGAPARLQMSFGGGAFEFRLGEVGPPTGARGKTFNFQVSLALAQLWTSHAPVLRWARKVRCPHCNGMGATADHVHTCPYCNGAGLEAAAHQHGEEGPHGEEEGAPARGRAWGVLAQELASTCAACGGLGMVTDRGHVCRQCKGMRLVDQGTSQVVQIPAGAPSSFRVEFPGLGDAHELGESGAAVVTLSVKEDGPFTRVAPDGADIEMVLDVPLHTALAGLLLINVTHPLGHHLLVNRTGTMVAPGDVEVFPGQGLPVVGKEGEFGDAFVHFNITFPEVMSTYQRSSLLSMGLR